MTLHFCLTFVGGMLEHTDYVTQLMVAQRLTVKQSVILSWEAFECMVPGLPERSLIGTVLYSTVCFHKATSLSLSIMQ